MRKKCTNNSKLSLNGTTPPLRDDNRKLATISEGCSVIRANCRPPGGSITWHHGIFTLPCDEKPFMGM